MCSDDIDSLTYVVKVNPKGSASSRGVQVYANTLEPFENITASTVAINERCIEVLLRFLGSSQSLSDSIITLTVKEKDTFQVLNSTEFNIFYESESIEITTTISPSKTTEAAQSTTSSPAKNTEYVSYALGFTEGGTLDTSSFSESTSGSTENVSPTSSSSFELATNAGNQMFPDSDALSLSEVTGSSTTASNTSDGTTKSATSSVEVTLTGNVIAKPAESAGSTGPDKADKRHVLMVVVLPVTIVAVLLFLSFFVLGLLLRRTKTKREHCNPEALPTLQQPQRVTAEPEIIENISIRKNCSPKSLPTQQELQSATAEAENISINSIRTKRKNCSPEALPVQQQQSATTEAEILENISINSAHRLRTFPTTLETCTFPSYDPPPKI